MILIFDTSNGLCNQILDIQCSIYFSNKHKFKFTFRKCCFRKKDLITFYPMSFDKLFDVNSFSNIENFIKFQKLKLDIHKNNTFNFEGSTILSYVKNENELLKLIFEQKKKNINYFIIKQLFPICDFSLHTKKYYNKIKPSSFLFSIYLDLKKNILPEKYNFIHYRYENDFTDFFNINYVISIDSLIQNQKFKNKDLKIYIATSNLKSIARTIYLSNHIIKYKNIIFKDDYINKYNLDYLNFEEKAFIDFLIGLSSCEVIGHSKSSFSKLLNFYKQSNLYYDIY